MSALVRNLAPQGTVPVDGTQLSLFVHEGSGVALVRTHEGDMVSCHPNVHQRELDIKSMRVSGEWKQSDLTVRVGGFVYNLSMIVTETAVQKAARGYCQCGVCRPINATLDRINSEVGDEFLRSR